jgi:hypothetical protein
MIREFRQTLNLFPFENFIHLHLFTYKLLRRPVVTAGKKIIKKKDTEKVGKRDRAPTPSFPFSFQI